MRPRSQTENLSLSLSYRRRPGQPAIATPLVVSPPLRCQRNERKAVRSLKVAFTHFWRTLQTAPVAGLTDGPSSLQRSTVILGEEAPRRPMSRRAAYHCSCHCSRVCLQTLLQLARRSTPLQSRLNVSMFDLERRTTLLGEHARECFAAAARSLPARRL